MTRKVKARLLAAGTLFLFLLISQLAVKVLGVHGTNLWVLRGSLWLMGLVSGFLVLRLFSSGRTGEPEPRVEREIDALFAEAGKRLAGSRAEERRIRRLPVLLLLGPRDAAKTTLVERSGVDAELLAGEVYRGEHVVRTENLNMWLGEGTLFVEAGGTLLEEDARWSRLVRHLQPERFAAAFGRRRQAARRAVVCFPCGALLEENAAERVVAAAREIRERLRDLSKRLGIRLPVYVLFTKADRLPYFEDYLRNFTAGEVGQVLGATLPIERDGRHGSWAERESARLTEQFDTLFHRLALHRLELLRRETENEARAGIYEFPREFQKVRDRAVSFLVELCRPSQLSVNPLLRGFYFTGVRPVVVEEEMGMDRPDHPAPEDAPVGATMVFDRSTLQREMATPVRRRRERRVPEWVFLNRLVRGVLLQDPVAVRLTGGGTRVNLTRRILAGSVAALGLLLLLGSTWSFFTNRSLAREVTTAIAGVQGVPARGIGLPDARDLERLDALGEQLRRLRRYEVEGPPLSLRWFLYRGSALLQPARRAYLARFRPLLGDPARAALLDDLEALPGTPAASADYDVTYSALKGYLILGEHPERSTEEFLAPLLTRYRLRGHDGAADSAYRALVAAQYGIFSSELPYGIPYGWSSSRPLVDGARAYMARFQEPDQFYQTVIARASAEADSVRFVDAGGVLRSDHVVPGAFTRRGWSFIRSNLEENLEELLTGEEWVTGPSLLSEADLSTIADSLRRRYVRDYASHWHRFLSGASFSSSAFANLPRTAASLRSLGGNRSPVLQLFHLVSLHTAEGPEPVPLAFRPVQAVVPADTTDDRELVADPNRPYVSAVGGLYSSVDQAAGASGSDLEQALERAREDVRAVKDAVVQIQQTFHAGQESRDVEQTVVSLLERPADSTERLVGTALRRAPIAELNGKGQAFCRNFSPLVSRYPFRRAAATAVSVEDLDAALKPDEGDLWLFYRDALVDLMTADGRIRSGAEPVPTAEFATFFRRAAAISRAFYPGGSGPRTRFTLRLETSEALPEVTVNIDGEQATFTRTRTASQPFGWDGARASSARIQGRIAGGQEVLLHEEGTWALFRLLGRAEWRELGGRTYRLTWSLGGGQLPLLGELTLETDAPILNPAYLAGLDCVSTVAR